MSNPYMPFFVVNYEADTAHLTLEEDAIYMRLLRVCWISKFNCKFPADREGIKRRLRITHENYQAALENVIAEFFITEGDYIYSPRLLKEYERIEDKKKQLSKNGAKGGRPAKKETPIPPVQADLLTEWPAPDLFELFWSVYPVKMNKAKTLLAWAKAVDIKDPEYLISAAETYAAARATENAKYTIYPTNWLRDQRWADEPIFTADNIRSAVWRAYESIKLKPETENDEPNQDLIE